MIKEEKKDLVDRRELYRLMVNRMNEKSNGATLNSSLTLGEFMEILFELPLQDELDAVWILDGSIWRCSWCKMSALENFGKSFLSKRCPYCGRRMKMEGNLESKT